MSRAWRGRPSVRKHRKRRKLVSDVAAADITVVGDDPDMSLQPAGGIGRDAEMERRIDATPTQHELGGQPAFETKRPKRASLGGDGDGPADAFDQQRTPGSVFDGTGDRARRQAAQKRKGRKPHNRRGEHDQSHGLGQRPYLRQGQLAKLGEKARRPLAHSASIQNQVDIPSCAPLTDTF